MNPKEIRIELGLKKAEMARAIGVHVNLWHKWESGEQGVTACPRRKLDDLLWFKKLGILDKYLLEFCKKSI